MSKKYNEPIRVWGMTSKPEAFLWKGRLYRVKGVLQLWHVNKGWWQRPESRAYAIVSADCNGGEGVYELYFENLNKKWFLARVVD
jgi:hypothetical protein